MGLGLNLGHLVLEMDVCQELGHSTKGWPNLGRWLSQIWANTWLAPVLRFAQAAGLKKVSDQVSAHFQIKISLIHVSC
jgi:hypothetical protein